jgi:hypothetical protein
MKMRAAMLSAVIGLVCVGSASAALPAPTSELTYETLDYTGPGAVNTFLTGIRGDYIVGLYMPSSNVSRGLIYQRSTQTWTQLDVVIDGVPAPSTSPYGPDPVTGGLHVVGSYKLAGSSLDHGFFYDSRKPLGSAFVLLDYPSTAQSTTLNTIPHSIYGNNVVGNYDTSLKTGNAFLYNIQTQTYRTINKPNDSRFNPTVSTTAYGIWENHVAGSYTNLTGTHAYLHNLTTGVFTKYDYPGAILTHFDGITSNNAGAFNYTGDYLLRRTLTAFFFDGKTYTTLDYPGSVVTSGNSVYDRTVVGVYTDTGGVVHGYIATVPQSERVPFTFQWFMDRLKEALNNVIRIVVRSVFGR